MWMKTKHVERADDHVVGMSEPSDVEFEFWVSGVIEKNLIDWLTTPWLCYDFFFFFDYVMVFEEEDLMLCCTFLY